MKKIVRLTEGDLIRLVKRVISETRHISPSWEMKFTKWAENVSGNPELAMSLMERYWDLKGHPEMPVEYKDFNNLESAEELEQLIDEMEKVVGVNKHNQDITRVTHVFNDYMDTRHDADYLPKYKMKMK